MNGNELFRDAAGVGITECESVEEITARVRSVSNRASRALAVLVKVCREAFPVRVEGFEVASTTQPCFPRGVRGRASTSWSKPRVCVCVCVSHLQGQDVRRGDLGWRW